MTIVTPNNNHFTIMKKLNPLSSLLLAAAALFLLPSCEDTKSYAELLNDENRATNVFLADHVVVDGIPADNKFITVQDKGDLAPYYRLDEEGDVYMQVVSPGTPGNMATSDQLIFLRFMRYNIFNYKDGNLGAPSGNDSDLTNGSASFRFDNFQVYSSYQWGKGIQMPLKYLPIDAQVNVLIKSQSGLYSEVANVQPYLYQARYFKSQI